MSLGFLTESALVPSKAKAIKVDAKSLVDLKAVVFQKDQERQRRLREALTAENDDAAGSGALRLGKYAHLRGKSRKAEEGRKRRRNKGVEERNRRDEEAEQEEPDEDDDEAWSKRSAEMLRKKATLYEKMAKGGDRGTMKGEFLVDFKAKKDVGPVSTMVEITDAFGRSRKVATDSEEYDAFVQTQEREACRGEEVDRCVKGSRDEEQQERSAGGSFVVSQWEKRLKSSEKHHLKEVHERATLAQSLSHSSTAGTKDRKTRKQLRLERLRKQREQVAASEDAETKDCAAPKNAEGDAAASDKATDFLNELSSLM